MTEHTPGPWRRGIGNDCHTVFNAQGGIVADRCGTIDGTLIAAAPDMLNALRVAYEVIDGHFEDECEDCRAAMAAISAAIARAQPLTMHDRK